MLNNSHPPNNSHPHSTAMILNNSHPPNNSHPHSTAVMLNNSHPHSTVWCWTTYILRTTHILTQQPWCWTTHIHTQQPWCWTTHILTQQPWCWTTHILTQQPWLRDWSRSVGSYGNNTRVICYRAPGRPASAVRGTPPPDNKSLGCCCCNSWPTMINPDYNMTKQRCIKSIHDKIRSKSPSNKATSPTCLHCDVTHPSLTTGVVALYIPSWRVGVREERRQARKTVWPVNAGRVICRYQNNLCGIINHHKHIRECFLDV